MMDRRKLLKSAGATLGCQFFSPSFAQLLVAQGQSSNVTTQQRAMLVAQVEGARVAKNPTAADVFTLPALFALAKQDVSADSSKVRDVLSHGGDFSRETFTSAPDFFTIDNPEQYAHSFGVGLQVVGALAAPFNPVAGLALGVAGAIGEDMWKVVSSGGDLSKNPFIQKDQGELDLTTQSILSAATYRHDDNPKFGSMVESDALRQHLGIDFNSSQGDLLKRLPDEIKAPVTEAFNDSTSTLETDDDQEAATKAVLGSFSAQLKDYNSELKQYGDLLHNQSDASARQAVQENMAMLQNDFNASITIATFVLGRAMGDPVKANQIGQVLSATTGIGFAIASGNVIGALSAGLGLFQGLGTSPMDALSQQIQQLGKQLEDLKNDMDQRFDRLEHEQQQTFQELITIYKAVQDGFGTTKQQLDQLRSQFLTYWQLEIDDQRRKSFDKITRAFSSAMLVRDAHKSGWETQYLSALPVLVSHAVSESRASYYRGASLSGTTEPGKLTEEVARGTLAERLIGSVPLVCQMAGTGATVSLDLPNPFELAIGAEGYMQLDLLAGSLKNSGRSDALLKMWGDAILVRNAAKRITDSKTINALADACIKQSGTDQENPDNAPGSTLIGAVQALYKGWIANNLKQPYSVVSLSPCSKPTIPSPGETLYDANCGMRVSDSPLDEALKLNLIKLIQLPGSDGHEITNRQDPGPGFVHFRKIETYRYSVSVEYGPDKGRAFGNDRFTCLNRDIYLDDGGGQKLWCLVFDGSNTPWTVTGTFLDYCEKLLGYYYGTFTILTFADWLKDLDVRKWLKDNNLTDFQILRWADTSAAIRLATAYSQWRLVNGPEIDGQTDVRNIPLLTSQDDLVDWVRNILTADANRFASDPKTYFKSADPRAMKLHSRLADRVRADVADITKLPAPDSAKGLPVVDRLMKRLAGYMTANNITFPAPN